MIQSAPQAYSSRSARTVLLVAQAQKFAERGLNVIVPASMVNLAFLADPPAAGADALADAGAEIHRV